MMPGQTLTIPGPLRIHAMSVRLRIEDAESTLHISDRSEMVPLRVAEEKE